MTANITNECAPNLSSWEAKKVSKVRVAPLPMNLLKYLVNSRMNPYQKLWNG